MIMTALLLALLVGLVAGLRSMLAPALVSWSAHAMVVPVAGTWLAFLASSWTVGVFALLAAGEFVTDLLPLTPRRTVPLQLGGRLASGALVGAALSFEADVPVLGAVAGIFGALVGAYGGAAVRARLARTFDGDPPAAVVEDVVAVVIGLWATGLI